MEKKVKGISLEEEFKKNPECPVENFYTVKDWVAKENHLPNIPDQKIFQFLFSCFYDVEKTKKCIETFYAIKTNSPELYKNRDISDPVLQKVLAAASIFTLPVLTSKRYRITYFSLKSEDPADFDFINSIKLFLMAYDTALHLDGTARGHVVIFDLKNFGFRHIMKCNLDMWKKIIRLTQEALPVRKKTLHILNTNYFIYKFAQMLKPFIAPEVFSTIHLHRSTDMEDFYKYVPLECLPREYGGPLDCVDAYTKKFEEQLWQLRDFFNEDDKFVLTKKTTS